MKFILIVVVIAMLVIYGIKGTGEMIKSMIEWFFGLF